MFAKRIFFIISLVVLFLPQASFAQIDQRCWTRTQCEEARMLFGKTDAKDGFYQGTDATAACGKTDATGEEELGFCLPSGTTVTNISFGGKREFLHIGEFISDMFQYSIIVAGILAVIMIIIAGFQWTMSGGSPERIGSAKKRIGGAVIGLTIAVMSYTILNTINPNLVNLRLPQTWMINTQGIVPPYCSQVVGKMMANYAPEGTTLSQQAKDEKIKNAVYNLKPENATCGNEYLVDGTGGQICTGTFCDSGVCLKDLFTHKSGCVNATIAGNIRNSSIAARTLADYDSFVLNVAANPFVDFWAWEWVEVLQLAGVCASDGEPENGVKATITKNINSLTQQYKINITKKDLDKLENDCGNKGIRGYALWLEMNVVNNTWRESHIVGKNGIDLCDMYPSFAVFWEDDCEKILKQSAQPGIPHNSLFTREELEKGGILLDIDVGNISVIENENDKRQAAYGKYGWTP